MVLYGVCINSVILRSRHDRPRDPAASCSRAPDPREITSTACRRACAPTDLDPVDGATDDRDALRHVCEAYRKIDYDMEDEVNETLDCLGVVGVSSEVLTRAEQVNEAKAELKRVCLPLSRLRTRVPRKATKDAPESAGEGADTEMIQTTRAVLRSLQRSDLNLTAAYRKIPILGAPPRSITYVRARTRRSTARPSTNSTPC